MPFCSPCRSPLAAIGSPSGSLLATFWLPLAPFGSLWAPFGSLWPTFWLQLAPFWRPWPHFCSPQGSIFSHLYLLTSFWVIFLHFQQKSHEQSFVVQMFSQNLCLQHLFCGPGAGICRRQLKSAPGPLGARQSVFAFGGSRPAPHPHLIISPFLWFSSVRRTLTAQKRRVFWISPESKSDPKMM